ncbi:uncharacterized protein F4822DRAFT_141893 [Hypoxylon trugodes]|uniref:uncharacterized protein n=1 Tax=Hypoxylon trugodes TaxID=326681 RepID=UPI00218F5110|nr:uncharacterized protein F4822DRAFT_141893 [Hypoxylon trugodes]KAI1392816.1 hypothetical protein F4822DRAFT_141893 [Hypoxylon trugodes]
MPPGLYLTGACLKSAIWGAIFLPNLFAEAIVSAVLILFLFGTSFMQLIYGAILVHRQRKGTLMVGFYTPPDHSVGLPEGPVYGGAEPQDRYFRPSTAASSEYKSPLSSPSVASPQFGFAPAAYAPPGSYELDGRARHF